MKKKLVILIVFVLAGIIIGMFFFQSLAQRDSLNSITEEEIDRVLSLIRENTPEDMIMTYGDFIKRESLINLVHITKNDLDYQISCFFGSAYENANLYKMFPEKLVSMGQIKKCDIETAKLIDEAVKSQKIGCEVFMSSLPSSFVDYYFFAITIERREITQEWIDRLNEKWMNSGEDVLQCFKPMESLLGETIAKHGTGIVDLNQDIVHY